MLTKLQTAGAALMLTAVLTTGIVYAAPQAGDSLQTWYEKSYTRTVQILEQKLLKQSKDKLNQAEQKVSAAQQSAGRSELREYQSQWLDQFDSTFNQRKEDYIEQTDAARAELLGKDGAISQQFAGYTEQVTREMDSQLELEIGGMLDSLLLEQPVTAGSRID